MTARLRDFEVTDLLSLTQFFGFDTETFSLAVNWPDRFLSKMKVQPKHIGCVGLSCLFGCKINRRGKQCCIGNWLNPSKCVEVHGFRPDENGEDCIGEGVLESQIYYCLFVSTTLSFTPSRECATWKESSLNFERLEAQIKTCYCRIIFSKAKPCVSTLSIIALEIQAQKWIELTEGVEHLQKLSKISGRNLTFWQELVFKCLTEHSSNKCAKPNILKLKWIVSGRSTWQLRHRYYRTTHLPTITEMAL